jgi:hypothetical protein
MDLVANRECGSCSICCINLRIEEVNLKKLAGTPCIHLSKDNGCSIYLERPEVCRNWYCGWRYMKLLDEDWRPDKSDILIRPVEDGLIFESIKDSLKLANERTLGIIGGGIELGLSIYISVPKEQGFCNSIVKINERLNSSIDTNIGYLVQIAMLKAILFALEQNTDPVTPL